MKTVNICGTNCRKDMLKTFTYEQLADLAKQSGWNGDVDKELKKHGFKPSTSRTNKTKANKSNND